MSSDLYGVACPTASECFAVGAGGTVLQTTNSGVSWVSQTSGSTSQLNAASCQSSSSCWAVGAGGTVLATTNAGATWSPQMSGTSNALYGVSCVTGACVSVGALGTAFKAVAPSNTAPPTITGTTTAGKVLAADPGSWSGWTPVSYSYQWQDCNSSGGSCTNISGATASTYTLASSDVGDTIVVSVAASNSLGSSASASSSATGVVQALPPSNTSAPTITGTAKQGQVLAASPGSWSGSTPISYSYQWQDCSSLGGACSNIAGATASTYTLASSDVGNTIVVIVTASNSSLPGGGEAAATSDPTMLVVGLPSTTTFEYDSAGRLTQATTSAAG